MQSSRREFLRNGCRAALAAGFLPSVGSGVDAPKARRSWLADLEALLPKLMEENRVPGLSIALVAEGRTLWHRGFGVKSRATNAPVNERTLFEAASVSKTVFAYAVMKLCENGEMDLDAPLAGYGAKPLLTGDARMEKITARQVLSHTSGFQDFRSRSAPLKIHFEPGQAFLYSGEGYYYLQSVVTHLKGRVDPNHCAKYEAGLEVCGTDFDAWMKRVLLAPFSMRTSGYLWNSLLARQGASPHDSEGNAAAKKRPAPPDVARYGACGGLHTTALEYAKFLIEVIDPKSSGRFRLGPASIQEMLRPQIKLPYDQQIDGADSWALGWAVQNRKTGKVIVHSGGQSGFQSLTMASVDRRTGFIVLTNSDNGWKIFHNAAFRELMNNLLETPG